MAYHNANANVDIKVATSPIRDLAAETRDHLIAQLRDARAEWTYYSENNEKLRVLFGISFEAPKSPKEFLERIKNKQYTLVSQEKFEEMQEKDGIGDTVDDFFSWKDPAIKVDREGYEARIELMRTDYQNAIDIIMVKSAEEGLKALRDFQKKDYTIL